MTPAPSPKEALECARNTLMYLRTKLTEPDQGRGWVSLGGDISDAIEKIEAALAAFQPDGERREAIARIKNRIDSHLNDYLCDMKPGYDDSISGFNEAWDIVRKLFDDALASGFVQNEAAIRDDEREKLLGMVTDKLKSETSERYAKGWNNALLAITTAIRSARDGGAET